MAKSSQLTWQKLANCRGKNRPTAVVDLIATIFRSYIHTRLTSTLCRLSLEIILMNKLSYRRLSVLEEVRINGLHLIDCARAHANAVINH